ncbi:MULTISPECIES: DUF6602 domain-containing protein [Vibrio]|uniref:DUF6602 domain-containing protein n=1 Tax=Vibrio tasmaniensis TaxID=212663 RepID=A0A2N7NF44_9VIBR|nr:MULTISPECIES: DUF6602 domain-containing protein [Vibrio]PMP11762.1 hypothetical protein BCS92_19545 [Vibrio tasmaniensis]PTP73541.1 hypothetical protein CWO23_06240 [Vibrio splendidus]TKG26562.1 hypothetical protein FC057_24350 [Vibrio tasmaniensis]TKG37566.1 hypothetical protein FC063_22690 [Vibrio tasmaniensis]TKG42246.1 hypothetical protein FC060_21220 [Vibrio tasmaniensis]
MTSYNGYIQRLSKKVVARLNDIEAIYNFDLGDEFEIAMCHLLSDFLPEKFGVCRGFVISESGELAGDDLIIFDKMSFPVLRPMHGNNFSIKQQIPIEAVYSYIECKNSINDELVFDKALSQVRAVKNLILQRAVKNNPDFETNGPIYNNKPRDWPRNFPKRKNQPFCAIISKSSNGFFPDKVMVDPSNPDLMILGEDRVATQTVNLGSDGIKSALFYDEDYWFSLAIEEVKGDAFGIGIVTLLHALGWIELLPIEWGGPLNRAYWDALSNKA